MQMSSNQMSSTTTNSFSEGTIFYLMKKGHSKVKEIRRKVKISGKIRYLIDRKRGDVGFVSENEFFSVNDGFHLVVID